MSKNNINARIKDLNETLRSEPGSIEFTNSRGVKIQLVALSPYLVQMATESVERPEVPSYEITTADGIVEVHKYDEKSINDPKTPEADKLKWKEFEELNRKADLDSSEILLNLILIEGVKLEIDDEERWLKRQKLMGIKVPEDPEERLLMYKKQYVIGNMSDIEKITKTVMELTGVSREEIDKVKKSFPGNVESEGTSEASSSNGSEGK